MPPVRRFAPHCPPNSTSFVGGRPRDDFSDEVRKECPRVTHCLFRSSSSQNANLESEREGNPQTWGSQTRRFPMLWQSARRKRSATQRQARFAGGMSCALHNLQRSSPPRNADFESKREFAPYFKRSAEMGGSKRAVIPLLWRPPRPLARWFTKAGAVCGGRRRSLRGAAEREAREGRSRALI
jgi:hypothetical protein